MNNFFTIGAFDNILSEQNISFNAQENEYFDEDKELKNAINKLSYESPIMNFNELKDKIFIL